MQVNPFTSDKVGFIDSTGSAIYTITTIGDSWTATENCWAIARARKTDISANNPQVSLDSAIILNVSGLDYGFAVFPVKKGQVINTRNTPNVAYSVEFRSNIF